MVFIAMDIELFISHVFFRCFVDLFEQESWNPFVKSGTINIED